MPFGPLWTPMFTTVLKAKFLITGLQHVIHYMFQEYYNILVIVCQQTQLYNLKFKLQHELTTNLISRYFCTKLVTDAK